MLKNANLVSRQFQGDPRNIRMLGPVQSFMLLIQAGLQSGDSRRIEISEGMFSMPITVSLYNDPG